VATMPVRVRVSDMDAPFGDVSKVATEPATTLVPG
jgi:hypothetical protein